MVDRFSQIDPSIVFSVEAVYYNGKVHDHLGKLLEVVKSLPSIKKVVIIPFVHHKKDIDLSSIPNRYSNILLESRTEVFIFININGGLRA